MGERLAIKPFVLINVVRLNQVCCLSPARHSTDRHNNTVMHKSQWYRAPRCFQGRPLLNIQVAINRPNIIAHNEITRILSVENTTDKEDRIVLLHLDRCELCRDVRIALNALEVQRFTLEHLLFLLEKVNRLCFGLEVVDCAAALRIVVLSLLRAQQLLLLRPVVHLVALVALRGAEVAFALGDEVFRVC